MRADLLRFLVNYGVSATLREIIIPKYVPRIYSKLVKVHRRGLGFNEEENVAPVNFNESMILVASASPCNVHFRDCVTDRNYRVTLVMTVRSAYGGSHEIPEIMCVPS